jgi:hypothetical protein
MGTGSFFPLRVKQPGHETEHSPPSSAGVKNGEAIPPLPHMSLWYSAYLIKHRNNFFLPLLLQNTSASITFQMNTNDRIIVAFVSEIFWEDTFSFFCMVKFTKACQNKLS